MKLKTLLITLLIAHTSTACKPLDYIGDGILITALAFESIVDPPKKTCTEAHLKEVAGSKRYRKINDTIIDKDFYTQGIALVFPGFFGSEKIKFENGSVVQLDEVSYATDLIMLDHKKSNDASIKNHIGPTIKAFPLQEGEERTFQISAQITADYYSIVNLISLQKQSLAPVTNVYEYIGLTNDNTLEFQESIYGDGYTRELSKYNVTIANPDDMSLEYSVSKSSYAKPISTFPSVSPTGDFRLDHVHMEKTWVGKINVKVIQNSASIFRVNTVIQIKNGNAILEYGSDISYDIKPRECFTRKPSWGG